MSKKTYIVAGDSWSMGEFFALKQNVVQKTLPHRGLAQCLEQDGHRVHHLSTPGISNWDTAKIVASFLSRTEEHIDGIFVCQTGFEKDLKYTFDDVDWTNRTRVDNIAGWYLWDFYQRLDHFYTQYKIPTFLIGAKTDTMWFDDLAEKLPGLTVVCQSMINYVLFDQDRVEKPVYSWYDRTTIDIIKQLYNVMDASGIEDMLDCIDRGMHRESLVTCNTEYFWPDGIHPNRKAWIKLYNLLTERGYVPVDR